MPFISSASCPGAFVQPSHLRLLTFRAPSAPVASSRCLTRTYVPGVSTARRRLIVPCATVSNSSSSTTAQSSSSPSPSPSSTQSSSSSSSSLSSSSSANESSLHADVTSGLLVGGDGSAVVSNTLPPLLRFAKLLCQYWRLLVPGLVCAVVASVCAVIEPMQFGRILAIISTMPVVGAGAGVAGMASTSATGAVLSARTKLFKQVGLIALTYTIELICTAIFISLAARAADAAIRRLRESVFRATIANDVAFFDHAGRTEVERTTTLQLRIARQAFWDNLGEDRGIRAVLEASLGVFLCIRLVGAVGIPAFCLFIPILSFLVAQLGLKTGRLYAKVESKEADILSFISERLRGLTTVKAFGAERKEFDTLSGRLDDAQDTARQFIGAKSSTAVGFRINIYLTILAFFVFGGILVSTGSMTFETFSSLVGFIWILNFSMHGLLFTFTDTAKASVALKQVYEMLDRATTYREQAKRLECPPEQLPATFDGYVSFRDVVFHYPSRPDAAVLRDVSFDIRPGQTVALVGESGGGKSTVASLLCRFYRPSQGSVQLDGQDIQSIPADVYASQLSVVNQEPFLFQGSIRDNIAYGVPDASAVSDDDIIRAAKEANAHDFICGLQHGYDTLWHPGSNLSGGQKQRIAIARSLLKQPRILVLDEATSALDQESERAVQAALERIMRDRTTLIIAHRLSTIRSADLILVVKNGAIVERGSFDQLYATPDGIFRNLVDSSSAFVTEPPSQTPSDSDTDPEFASAPPPPTSDER